MIKYDFHIHSNFSDGFLHPKEIVKKAADLGMQAIALTDHDSVLGVDEFLRDCQKAGIKGIPGVEVSTELGSKSFHLLGYGVDVNNPLLQEELQKLYQSRIQRSQQYVKKLSALGFKITEADLWKVAKNKMGSIGKPHVAQAVISKNKGDVRIQGMGVANFLKSYLSEGKPAFVSKRAIKTEKAIKLIKDAGGVSVLAHPLLEFESLNETKENILKLKSIGLDGVEVFYAKEHKKEDIVSLKSFCQTENLLMTAGSDTHFYPDSLQVRELGKIETFGEDISEIAEKFLSKLKN